jgi:hypothetical protein
MNETKFTHPFSTRAFVKALVANIVWINLSEVFRYFALVMPMMRSSLSAVHNVAPMDVQVFAIWGVWDTILVFAVTGFVWLFLERFGYGRRNALIAGVLFWIAVFVILWLGLFNMNLATLSILAAALPLALVEIFIAAIITDWSMRPDAEHNA